MAVSLIVADRDVEYGIAIDIMPVICQGDYDLVGPSNVSRQLPDLGSQLAELSRQRIHALEQLAHPKCAANRKSANVTPTPIIA